MSIFLARRYAVRMQVFRLGAWRYVRLARLVLRLPTYARLVWGLMRDPRVPVPLKGLLLAALAYVFSPVDMIPDAIPVLGQADDLTVLLLVLGLFIRNAPAEVRDEHMRRARDGSADLDRDLARLRALLGGRFDTIRDNLPRLLERYGELRDPQAIQALLAGWRDRRVRRSRSGASAPGATRRLPDRELEEVRP